MYNEKKCNRPYKDNILYMESKYFDNSSLYCIFNSVKVLIMFYNLILIIIISLTLNSYTNYPIGPFCPKQRFKKKKIK